MVKHPSSFRAVRLATLGAILVASSLLSGCLITECDKNLKGRFSCDPSASVLTPVDKGSS